MQAVTVLDWMAFFYAREGRWKEKTRLIEIYLAEVLLLEMRRSADKGWRAGANWPGTQRATSLPLYYALLRTVW